ncbi:MAG TPA: hypothetical protein VFD48_17800 [Pyrinomonadaceae bacterium]|nr:hypothetical protein [Pyrinomonadaceae bacterium]
MNTNESLREGSVRFHSRAMMVVVITFLLLLTTQAQQSTSDIVQLETDIAKLTAFERNSEIPDELRALNQSILDSRKNRLRLLLEQKLSTLREYRRVVSLSASESEALDDVIRNVEKQLHATSPESLNVSGTSNASTVKKFAAVKSSVSKTVAPVSPAPNSHGTKPEGKPEVQTIRVDNKFKENELDKRIKTINTDDASAFDLAVSSLINDKLEEKDGLYCVVHIVEWVVKQDPKVKQDAWFLYRYSGKESKWKRQENFDGKRIYGSNEVAVLFVHASVSDSVTDISYKISIQKKIPAPVSDVLTLIGSITSAKAAAKALPSTDDLYAASLIKVEDVPSDMVFTGSLAVEGQQTQVLTRTYDNEGRYHWDVSLGVPIKTIRELQFVSDGNKVTTSAKDRQDVYGFLNIYPWKVDVKDEKALTPPHFLVGVPLASKPLHHPLIGIGFGIYKAPIKFNIFGGVVFNRELVPRTLTSGSNATPAELEADLHPRWVRKFSWGINFPISQIKDALK